jgi:Flp pilus assembly protein TadD
MASRNCAPVQGRPSVLRRIGTAFLLGTALGMAALGGGCMSRLGDTTGSLGGQRQMSQEQWRQQASALGARYEANPGDRNASFGYASALRALNQNAQALAILQTAVLKHTNDMEMLGLYGRALADAGRLKEAQDVLQRAHTPERPDWRILSVQGAVSDQLGEHESARAYYETALKIAPGEPSILSNLGLSLALSKQLPQAETVLREAARHPRADARVRQNLVLVLGLQGRFSEAEQVARQDQTQAQAQSTIADLKRMVSQPNSWDALKNPGRKPSGTSQAARPASARSAQPAVASPPT